MKNPEIPAEFEKKIEDGYKSLERSAKCAAETVGDGKTVKKDHTALKTALSAAAVIALFIGLYAGIRSVSEPAETEPALPGGSTAHETDAREKYLYDFPYEKPTLTEAERASIDRLLEEIEYDLFQNDGQMLPGLTDAAAAYGTKIIVPLKEHIDTFRELDGPSAEDGRRLDVACADVLRLIIKQSGEEGFIDGIREKYGESDAIPEGLTFDQAYSLLGMKELADQIYEAKILNAERYAERVGAVSTSYKTEYLWCYTDKDGKTVYFSPRGLFGADYPVCLYIHDVFYGIQDYEGELRLQLKGAVLLKCTELEATGDVISDMTELCDKLPVDDLVRLKNEFGDLRELKGEYKTLLKKYLKIIYVDEPGVETVQKTIRDERIDEITGLCRENGVDPDTVVGIAYELSDEDLDLFISGLSRVIADRAATKSFLKQWTKKLSDPSVTVEIPEVTGRETKAPVSFPDPDELYGWYEPGRISPLYEHTAVLTSDNYPPLKFSQTMIPKPTDPDIIVSNHVDTLIGNGGSSLEAAGLGYAVCVVRPTGTDPFPFSHEGTAGFYEPSFDFEILKILKTYGSERVLKEGLTFKAALPGLLTKIEDGGKTLYHSAGVIPVTRENAMYLVLLCASDEGAQEGQFSYLSPDGISVSRVYSPGLPSTRLSLSDITDAFDFTYPESNTEQLKKIMHCYLPGSFDLADDVYDWFMRQE